MTVDVAGAAAALQAADDILIPVSYTHLDVYKRQERPPRRQADRLQDRHRAGIAGRVSKGGGGDGAEKSPHAAVPRLPRDVPQAGADPCGCLLYTSMRHHKGFLE